MMGKPHTAVPQSLLSTHRCRACKKFKKKKKQCCSADHEVCREVVPEEKVDQCFSKCANDQDCATSVPPDPENVAKTKYKANYNTGNKYNKEKDYVAKEDKYANKNDRRLEYEDGTTSGTRRVARRRMYSHDMIG